MRVFMLGWEFPPFISGGLGTACYGLTKALDQLGVEITFVLPTLVQTSYATHVKLVMPGMKIPQATTRRRTLKNVKFKTIKSPLQPYERPDNYQQRMEESLQRIRAAHGRATPSSRGIHYHGDMYKEVHRYADLAVKLAAEEEFDVVHAHDWMTYPAGIAVARATGKPLVVHVHSTEFDRSGEHVNQMVYDIERMGMHAADKIIAVSFLTRNIIIGRYGVSGSKVEVVYNGVERNGNGNGNGTAARTGISKDEKVVLFLGRITMQKGPDYFLRAAKKVLEKMNNVKFVMVGSGDLMHRAVEMAAELGIGSKVLFTGFLQGADVQKIYKMADLYVMPSVSEPFGIAPLEALDNDVPVIISKQSGVAEVLKHALKVDFWDVDEIANKIIAVLQHPALGVTLRNHGNYEVGKLKWSDSAVKCSQIYEELLVGAETG
ncbi:MAG: glycosyltransferase family 4 protein [Sedimentisphaerales bacterium]|nr:glycosyltransferase family 4 protein [Sedimentisphaerales bacterium]